MGGGESSVGAGGERVGGRGLDWSRGSAECCGHRSGCSGMNTITSTNVATTKLVSPAVSNPPPPPSCAFFRSTRTRKERLRPDGRWIKFDDNACVLLNQKGDMLGSRVTGVVGAELKISGRWGKVLSLAPKVRLPSPLSLFSFLEKFCWYEKKEIGDEG